MVYYFIRRFSRIAHGLLFYQVVFADSAWITTFIMCYSRKARGINEVSLAHQKPDFEVKDGPHSGVQPMGKN